MGVLAWTWRSELRRRARGWVGSSLLIGLAAGAVMTAAAGARRAETADERFRAAASAADASAVPVYGGTCLTSADELPDTLGAQFQANGGACLGAVEALSGIADMARLSLFDAAGTTDDGTALDFDFETESKPQLVAAHDDVLATRLNRPKLVKGRRADPRAVDELEVGIAVAGAFDIEVGTTIDVELTRAEALDGSDIDAPGDAVELHVVGITASPGELDATEGGYFPAFHATPAFHARYAATNFAYPIAFVSFAPGSSLTSVRKAVSDGTIPVIVSAETFGAQIDSVGRATHVEALALWLVAGVLTLSALAFCGQALARQARADSDDAPTMAALGMRPRDLRRLALLRSFAVTGVGALLGVLIAVAGSTVMPIGLSSTIEPVGGVTVDLTVLALGGVLAAFALLPIVLVSTLDAAWSSERSLRSGWRLARVPARSLPVPVSHGVRMAFDPGGGRNAVPVRSGLVGVASGAALLVAAVVFSASIDHLLARPDLAGWNWDLAVFANLVSEDEEGEGASAAFVETLRRDPDVVGIAAAAEGGGEPTTNTMAIEDLEISVLGVDTVSGDVGLSIVSGRAPRGDDEIALGSETMRTVAASVGDEIVLVHTVLFDDGSGTRFEETTRATLHVVGRVALPSMSAAGGPGRGAAMTLEGLARMSTETEGDRGAADLPGTFLVRLRDGADHDAAEKRLRTAANDVDSWRRWARLDPLEVTRVQRLPVTVAGVVAVLALGTVAHVVLTTTRRRRRELAVLKSLGFVRRQLRLTMWSQATALVIVALVVGIPLGVLAGRVGWNVYAGEIGVVSRAAIPLTLIPLGIVVGALVVANLVAALPARLASAIPAAEALRAE